MVAESFSTKKAIASSRNRIQLPTTCPTFRRRSVHVSLGHFQCKTTSMITDARLFNVVETTDVAAIRVRVEPAQTATTIDAGVPTHNLMDLTIGQASSVIEVPLSAIEVPLSVIEVPFMKVRMAMVVTAIAEEATIAATTVDRATITIETSIMGTTVGNRTKGETMVHS